MSPKQQARKSVSDRPAARSGTPVRVQQPDPVPYIVRWSGERDARVPVVARRGRRGISYTDERSFDRDAQGVLWARSPSQPGRGSPQYGKVHSLRQRLCMGGLLCQICGGPADRDPDGTLWLIDADPGDLRYDGELTTHPPVCLPCAHRSVRACPHLRPAWVALRVRSATPYGVNGTLYRPGNPTPAMVTATDIRLDDPILPWVRASQLIMRLNDFTPTDLTGQTR